MGTIVFLDLSTISLDDKKKYRASRKFLLLEGFTMLQKSVYCKPLLNQINANTLKDRIEENRPSMEIVRVLTVTEKQFQSMEYIVGEDRSSILDTDEGLIVL